MAKAKSIVKGKIKKPKLNHYRDEAAIIGFGNKVRELRIRKNMTIEQFANSHDIYPNQLARIERGETNPTISSIFLIANLFNVKPSDLLDFDK